MLCDLVKSCAFPSTGTSRDGNSVDGVFLVFDEFRNKQFFIDFLMNFCELMSNREDVGVDGVSYFPEAVRLVFLVEGKGCDGECEGGSGYLELVLNDFIP